MPFNFSASHSSRIRKSSQRKPPSLKRSSTSIFDDQPRRKPVQRSRSKPEGLDDENEDFLQQRLEDIGLVKSLATDLSLRDVAQVVQYAQSRMFDPIPDSGGFNSVRVADTLNFRKSLPPAVTVVHVHALLSSPTTTEKEISELAKAGTIRRLLIPGRGTGGSSVGEALTLHRDVERLVQESGDISPKLAGVYGWHTDGA